MIMFDYEDKNINSVTNEMNDSDNLSENKVEIAELKENTEQKITYGAVYYPQQDGKAYACNQYSTNQEVKISPTPANDNISPPKLSTASTTILLLPNLSAISFTAAIIDIIDCSMYCV